MWLTGRPFLLEAEDEERYYTWRPARAELDPVARTITLRGVYGGTPTITIPISEITGFEIVKREGISTLSSVALGLLLADSNTGFGCLLSILLAPVAIVDRIISRRTRFPIIRLTQSGGAGSGQGWVIYMRSKKRGHRGREETREFARHIADLLHKYGYSGSMPDLSIDELWFAS